MLDATWGAQRVRLPALVMGSTAVSVKTWEPRKGLQGGLLIPSEASDDLYGAEIA